MRDVIGLDLDSVLCNTEFIIDKYLREEFGVFLDWENEVTQYKVEKLPTPYNYSEYATKKLKNEGFSIAIITSRSENLKFMSMEWLRKYHIVYDMIYTVPGLSKYEIIEDIGIKAFVEDRFDVLESVVDKCGTLDYGLYVINQPWNKRHHLEQIIRVNDVAQAVDRIVEYRKWLGYFTHKCQGNIEKFIKEYQDGK
jgi:uncharacterized HAD superfamily protein